jgi:hypothetical protein
VTSEDYETSLKAAEQALAQAKTADDIRSAWRAHFGALGHRTLGRLLLGRTAAELLARRESRASDRD